jgi:Tfp pilus assembly PilM family ATPase
MTTGEVVSRIEKALTDAGLIAIVTRVETEALNRSFPSVAATPADVDHAIHAVTVHVVGSRT